MPTVVKVFAAAAMIFVSFGINMEYTGEAKSDIKPDGPPEAAPTAQETAGSAVNAVNPADLSKDDTPSALAEIKAVDSIKGSAMPKRQKVVGNSPAARAFAAREAVNQYYKEKAYDNTMKAMAQATATSELELPVDSGPEPKEAATAKAAQVPADIPASALAQTAMVPGGPLLPAMATATLPSPASPGAHHPAHAQANRKALKALEDDSIDKQYNLQRVLGLKMSAVEEGTPSSDRRQAASESRFKKLRGGEARSLHLAPDAIADLDLTRSQLRKARSFLYLFGYNRDLFVTGFAALTAAQAGMIETQSAINAVQSACDSGQPADAVEAALVAVEAAEKNTQAAMQRAAKAMNSLDRRQLSALVLMMMEPSIIIRSFFTDVRELDDLFDAERRGHRLATDAAKEALEKVRSRWGHDGSNRFSLYDMHPAITKILTARKAYRQARREEELSKDSRPFWGKRAEKYRIFHRDNDRLTSEEERFGQAEFRFVALEMEKHYAAQEAKSKINADYNEAIAAIWIKSLQGGTQIAEAEAKQRNQKAAEDEADARARVNARDAEIVVAAKAWLKFAGDFPLVGIGEKAWDRAKQYAAGKLDIGADSFLISSNNWLGDN